MSTPDTTTPEREPQNGFGVAALVLGIVAVVSAVNGWWLFLLPIAAATGILAVVFGWRGRRKAASGEATNRGQATAGLALGSTALGLLVAGVVAFAAFGGDWDRSWDKEGRGASDSFSECIDDADGTADLLDCIESFPEEAADAGLVADG